MNNGYLTPPPKSQITILSFFLTLYAKAADTGSGIIRTTSNPALTAASLIADFCLEEKYAGAQTTA